MNTFRYTLVSLFLAFSDLWTEYRPDDLLLREAYRCQLEGKLDCAKLNFREFLTGHESAYVRSEFAKVLYSSGDTSAALAEARRAIETNPNVADYHILYARLLNDTHENREAILHLKKRLAQFPNNPLMEFYLSEFQYQAGEVKEAMIGYSSVLFRLEGFQDPTYRNIVLWRLAEIYLKTNDPDRSKLYLLRYIKASPDHNYARYILGLYIYFATGDYESARRELEFLHREPRDSLLKQGIDPDTIAFALGQIYFLYGDFRCRSILGDLHLRKKDNQIRGLYLACEGDYENAAKALLPEWKKNRNHFINSIAILRILMANAWREETAQEILRVSTLAKNPGQHRIMIPILRVAIQNTNTIRAFIPAGKFFERLSVHYENSGNHNRAVLYLRKSIEEPGGISGKEWDKMLRLVALLAEQDVGRYDEAESICSELLSRNGKNPDLLFNRAIVRIKKRRFEEALDDLNEAIAIQKESVTYYFYRAIVYREIEMPLLAESDLEKVLEVEPDFPEALNFLGYLYAERNIHLDRSLELIGRAVDQSPANGGFQDSLGWIYFRLGRYEEAIHHLELASLLLREFEEEDPVVFDHLGDAYRSAKYFLKAAAAYRQALTLLEKEGRDAERIGQNFNGKRGKRMELIRNKLDAMRSETD